MRPVARVVVSLTVVAGLVGCSSPESDLPGVTASPTVSSTSSPTPTPTPTVDYSDAELGIVFEDDAQRWSGVEAEVYHWAATYETEYWRTMTTNTASPLMSSFASAEIGARIQQIADNNTAIQADIGGVYRVAVQEVVAEGETARAVVCVDYRDVTFKDPNGSWTPDEVGFGGTTREELTLERVADEKWLVLTATVTPTC